LPQVGIRSQQELITIQGWLQRCCWKVEDCWAGRRACVWLVVCWSSQFIYPCDAPRRVFHALYLQSKPCCTDALSFNACTTCVCMATLYLIQLPTSRLPAMRVSCCRPANIHLLMAYACQHSVVCLCQACKALSIYVAMMVLTNQNWLQGTEQPHSHPQDD